MTFLDVERNLVTWVKTRPGVVGAGTVAPLDMEARLAGGAYVRVANLGGPDDSITDAPTVDVDVFALTRDAARDVAEDIRASLRPRTRAGGAIIDSVRTSVSPRQLPWTNEKIKRFGATYRLGLRR